MPVPMPAREAPVIDLHTHSSCSDGTQSPADLVHAAGQAGVQVLGLTDHDVIAGWAAADAAGAATRVTVVPGVELSTQVVGISVHTLAYLIDPLDTAMVDLMAAIRGHRESRLRRMVQVLAVDGYPVDYEAIVAHSGPGVTLGRPHVADALVRAGSFPDRDAVFATVLHGSSPYYVHHWAPQTLDAVQLIRAAGGVPIMAHPFARARGRTITQHQIEVLVDAGLAGLEVHHPDHDAQDTRRAAELCRRLGVIGTGSSDYHGAGKPNRLAEQTTDLQAFQRLCELGSGTPLLGAPLAQAQAS
ncbi:MAG: PHP domain-containing protein [Ornithinimicrobium sp.]